MTRAVFSRCAGQDCRARCAGPGGSQTLGLTTLFLEIVSISRDEFVISRDECVISKDLGPSLEIFGVDYGVHNC